ncbi:MAG: MBL fold metallo-hydrolase [Methanosarcinales archaeon]
MKIQEGLYWYKERGVLDANTYVIKADITVIVDPGREKYLALLLEELQLDGIDPESIDSILITHLHPDHCDATAAFKDISGAKVALHSLQLEYLDVMIEEASRFLGISKSREFEADIVFEDVLSLGNKELSILHTPGHSPDSICLYAADEKVLLCGDLVFEKSIGRDDLPFGDGKELMRSINRMSALDVELLLPGHGAFISGKSNVRRNYEFIASYFQLL